MANYKTSWVQRLIEGAWQKTFAFAHAKTVYTDYANKKTLADKLSEIDTEIGNKANKTEIPTELPANGGNSSTVNGHTVNADVPENAVFTDTVYDDTKIQKRINQIGQVVFDKGISFTSDGATSQVIPYSFGSTGVGLYYVNVDGKSMKSGALILATYAAGSTIPNVAFTPNTYFTIEVGSYSSRPYLFLKIHSAATATAKVTIKKLF